MTDFDDIAPTAGDQGLSFEWIWDINTGTVASPVWVNVPDMTGLNPNATPKYKDGTTYANKGATSQSKTGEDFTLAVQVKGVKDETGEFQAELLALIDAADSTGADNVLGYRYYHGTSPSLAYQGTAAVNWSRVNTGNDDIEFFSFDLTGQGDRVKITNPAAMSPAVPSIMSALPAGAAAGATIAVEGSRFTGQTAATIGGVNVTTRTLISDDLILLLVPAGSAGAAPIIITNAAGASAAFPYTRT